MTPKGEDVDGKWRGIGAACSSRSTIGTGNAGKKEEETTTGKRGAGGRGGEEEAAERVCGGFEENKASGREGGACVKDDAR